MTTPDPTLAARLLPCPFCGCEAEIERFGNRRQSTLYQCKGCSCSLETGEEWGHGSDWNTRASDQLITTAEADARVDAAVQKALREHAGREETGESITEKYLRRYPQSKKTKAWEGAMVYLRTQNGIWRPDGHGYTVNFSEAWAMPLSDARKIVSGIYEDHGGTYFRATAAAIRSRGVTG